MRLAKTAAAVSKTRARGSMFGVLLIIEMRMITRCPGEREANIMTNDIGLLRKDDL